MSAASARTTLTDEVRSFYEAPDWGRANSLFHRLQNEDPIHRSDLGFSIVSRHADALTVFQSGKAVRLGPPRSAPDSMMARLTGHFLSLTQPPDHRRLRGLVQKAFTPKAIRDMEGQVRDVATSLVLAAQARGTIDVMADIARPLPATVFVALFDLSNDQRDDLLGLIGLILDGLAPDTSAEEARVAEAAAGQFIEVVLRTIQQRRQHPGDDLLSSLVQANESGDQLSDAELLSVTCQLFVAGMETTSGLLGSGLLTLLQHPDQLRRLRAEPTLLTSAVEECLRFAGPVKALPLRYATEDIELPDRTIAAGDELTIWLAAANRDPEVFVDPDRFDIERSINPHLAFSAGIHFCLGANLARLEAVTTLGAVIEALPSMRLPEQKIVFDSSSLMHRPASYLVDV